MKIDPLNAHRKRHESQLTKKNQLCASYDYGFVHVIHFTSELYFYPQFFQEENIQRQFDFLKSDLEAANKNRNQVPWIVTNAHRQVVT